MRRISGPRHSTAVSCLIVALWAAAPGSSPAQSPAPDQSDVIQADLIYRAGKMHDAIPLYERLAKQAPQNPQFAERLAFALFSKASVLPTGSERTELMARSKQEAERAKALGDDSSILHTVLEGVNFPDVDKNRRAARMNEAETAFTKGDYDAALKIYLEIAATDPTSYEARLFAGDVYFLRKSYPQAFEWFEKAIQVNPNVETAYRYWGDALMASGDMQGARQKFIDAVVVEPYMRRPWAGLRQWADRNGVIVEPPHIDVPASPQDNKITVDESTLKNTEVAAAWLAYSLNRALWQNKKFAERFPEEKQYRHSLAEEVDSLQGVVTVLGELKRADDIDDENLRLLVKLSRAGMIEPYVLLAAPDNDVAKDYAAYRANHADQLRAFVTDYVIKPRPATTSSPAPTNGAPDR
jgi:tetratricopeptide (TPR) repeat protein